jgi:hypothetical protein
MLLPPFQPKLPEIAECDQTPLVRSLLQIIGQQQEQIQRLEDEIRRLQGGPQRPQLKPNTLEPAGTAGTAADGEPPRRRGPQRAKTAQLTIHVTEKVPVADVPEGAEFKGYRRFVVQDLGVRFNVMQRQPDRFLRLVFRPLANKLPTPGWPGSAGAPTSS